jgi:hypothetical protein
MDPNREKNEKLTVFVNGAANLGNIENPMTKVVIYQNQ